MHHAYRPRTLQLWPKQNVLFHFYHIVYGMYRLVNNLNGLHRLLSCTCMDIAVPYYPEYLYTDNGIGTLLYIHTITQLGTASMEWPTW